MGHGIASLKGLALGKGSAFPLAIAHEPNMAFGSSDAHVKCAQVEPLFCTIRMNAAKSAKSTGTVRELPAAASS